MNMGRALWSILFKYEFQLTIMTSSPLKLLNPITYTIIYNIKTDAATIKITKLPCCTSNRKYTYTFLKYFLDNCFSTIEF